MNFYLDRKFAKFCPTYHITGFSGHIDAILYESVLHLFNFQASTTFVVVSYFNAIGYIVCFIQKFFFIFDIVEFYEN